MGGGRGSDLQPPWFDNQKLLKVLLTDIKEKCGIDMVCL